MHTPESIESALSRLMPPALSESGQRSIEAMLDELAGSAPPAARARFAWRFAIPGAIAAAVAVMAIAIPARPWSGGPVTVASIDPAVLANAAAANNDGLVVVGESDRIEEVSDQGWMGGSEGDALQATRCRVVETRTLRDEDSGMEVTVAEPREETLLIPVTMF